MINSSYLNSLRAYSSSILWENFKDGLSEDFMHLYHDLSRAHNMAYTDICEMMILVGHSILNVPSIPDLRVDNNNDENCN